MKHFFRLYLSLSLLFSLPLVAFASFTDVPSENEYFESISSLSEKGVITGNPDGSFDPQRILNRAELTAIVLRAAGTQPLETDKNCFPDVKEQWFAGVVCASKRLQILSGYQDGTFGPANDVTAGQAAKIMANALQKQSFQDLDLALLYVEDRNLIRQKYTPNQLLKRNEAAERIHRLLIFPGDDQVSIKGNPFDLEEETIGTSALTRETVEGSPSYAKWVKQEYESKRGSEPVILFFHAPWCPLCKRSDQVISDSLKTLSGEVNIRKVDYDTFTDLRKEFKVTYQDTFIILNAAGDEVSRKSGVKTFEDIQELLFLSLGL
ncbi:MAG: S-layer homology domain-containing protein [Candidatus Gracilibacteria bacterium]|nr:S-layer homology domain-containing protein [Candidatus Gracilibacteria bacterium]